MEDKDKTRKQPIDELAKLRKRVTELEKSEQHKISPEFLSDGYLSVDMKGKITDCNSAFLNLTGYSREDIVNIHFTKLPTLRLKEIPRYIKMFNSAKRGKFPRTFEFKWIHKDKTTHWGESLIGIIRKKRKISGINAILREITKKKQAEEALKTSLKTASDLIYSTPYGLFIYQYEKPDKLILLGGNPEAERLTGIKIDDWIGKENNEIWPEARNSGVTDAYLKVIKTGKTYKTEDLFYKDEKLEGAFNIRAFLLPEEKLCVSFENVTEKMKAEEILRESEAKYRILFESIADPIFIFDQKTHRFLDCNKNVLERYGYTLKELQALTPEQLHPPEELEDVEKNIDDEEDFSPHSYTHITKKGEKFQVEIHTSPLKYQGREAWISIVRDITERMRMEEALKGSEAKYRNLVERANDGVIITQDARVKFVNDQMAEMCGYTVEEMINTNFLEYVIPDERPKITDIYKRRTQGEDIPSIYEMGALHKNGSRIDIEVNSGIISYLGKNATFSFIRDITERKKAEEKIQRSQKELQNLAEHLQVATEQERGLIASELHDEVGQALTVLKMDLFLIKSKISKDQMEIPQELQKMENLLDDTIKKLRKIYSDLRPNLLEHFGVGEAMRQHCIDFQDQSGIKCIFYQDPEEIELDENRSIALYRILQGALNNIKWHAQATRVNIRLVEKGPNLKLTIKDNGKGIEEEQIKSSDSFGLIGMRERARYLGGELKITGIPDKGTTVMLEIPHQKNH